MIQTPTGESCPACGSRQRQSLFEAGDRLYATTEERFEVVECRGCRLIRLYPWPRAGELQTYYPSSYWFDAERSTIARLEQIYRRTVLRDHVAFVKVALEGVRGPVLDVGCGGGLFARMLREQGFVVFGMDYALDAAKVAWHSNGVPIVCAELASAPLRPASMAAITMFHVIEHLYDPLGYLQSAFALLAPGGRLVIQAPNAASWQFLLFGPKWNGIDVPRHLIDFRVADLERLLLLTGFEVVRRKHFSLRDNPAGFATSVAPRLDPMARRIRNGRESGPVRLAKDAAYFALVLASLPFTLLEAACSAGATVMIEARKPA